MAHDLGALGPGVPSVGPAWATIPLGTATGTYYLLACADDTQQIVEANEVNNCRAAVGTIAVGPATADYVVTAVHELASQNRDDVLDAPVSRGRQGDPGWREHRYPQPANTLR